MELQYHECVAGPDRRERVVESGRLRFVSVRPWSK